MRYFFHPLGDNYKLAINNVNTYSGHRVEAIDIPLPTGTPIYSMTTGTIDAISMNVAPYGGYGRCIVINSKNTGYAINKNSATQIIYAHLSEINQNLRLGAAIAAGTMIGKSGGDPNDPLAGQSTGAHLHLEFRKPNWDSQGLSKGLLADFPNISDVVSKWNSIKDRTVGGIKIENDLSYCHAIMTGNPEYIKNTGIQLTPTVNDVPNEYKTWVLSDRFMGPYPENLDVVTSSIQDKYWGLRVLSDASIGEFGLDNEGTSYGKLFRAYILYRRFEAAGNGADNFNTLQDFGEKWRYVAASKWGGGERAWSYGTGSYPLGAPVYATKEQMLQRMQNIYKNIKYPDIYGLDSQGRNYKEAVFACSNMPIYNNYPYTGICPYDELAFLVESPIFDGVDPYYLFRRKVQYEPLPKPYSNLLR